MSSLWTPEGEHRVTPPHASKEPEQAPSSHDAEREDLTRGALDEEEKTDIAALERELLEAPVEDVLANHCFGLFQLAALHLSTDPPGLNEARLAADALGALVDGLGDRLGPSAPTLKEGLTQLRLAFVKIATSQFPEPDGKEDANGGPRPS